MRVIDVMMLIVVLDRVCTLPFIPKLLNLYNRFLLPLYFVTPTHIQSKTRAPVPTVPFHGRVQAHPGCEEV
jgi:hypothetical protein